MEKVHGNAVHQSMDPIKLGPSKTRSTTEIYWSERVSYVLITTAGSEMDD
jgi:hypothetical protein